jgi:hypothetical protein
MQHLMLRYLRKVKTYIETIFAPWDRRYKEMLENPSFGTIMNYLNLGMTERQAERQVTYEEDPNLLNWLDKATWGKAKTWVGAFNPEDPWSSEHISDCRLYNDM